MRIERDAVPGEALSRAAQLRSKVENLQAAAPARAEGMDAGGAVRMVLGPDGLPVEIRVARRPTTLGVAIEEAFAASSAQRLQTWPVIGPAARSREPERAPTASGRPVEEIADEVVAALADAMSPPEIAPCGVGTLSGGALVLSVSPRSGVRCVCDAGWAARHDVAGLDAALAEALRAARADLAGAVPDPRRATLDALLAEARAALARIG